MKTHRFFCCKCGNEGIPLPRKENQKREDFHKKNLWCITCKQEVNHIEIKNPGDINIFRENFQRGEYRNAL